MNKLLVIIFSAAALLALPMHLSQKVVAIEEDKTSTSSSVDEICQGVGIVTGSDKCDKKGSTSSVSKIVRTAINIISLLVGIAAVVMIIVGGLKYITSGGDAAKTSSAKNTILYAIIGLVVVALAQVIVQFVLRNVDSTPDDGESSFNLKVNKLV